MNKIILKIEITLILFVVLNFLKGLFDDLKRNPGLMDLESEEERLLKEGTLLEIKEHTFEDWRYFGGWGVESAVEQAIRESKEREEKAGIKPRKSDFKILLRELGLNVNR